MRKFKFVAKLLAASVAAVSLALAAGAAEVTDISGHWSEEYVKYGIENGYINGYPDGTFLPDNPVTRAEFSKMMNSVLGLSESSEAEFFDVEEDAWYFPEVGKAVYAGYITGYEDGSFRAANQITRQEAAVIISRIATRPESLKTVDSFADSADVADWAKQAFDFAFSKGFFGGDDFGNLNPQATLTRAQAAKILCELRKSENIYNGDYTITLDSAVCSETVFTDDIYFAGAGKDASLILDGCTVLGTLYIRTVNDSSVTVDDSDINTIYVDTAFSDVLVENSATVKEIVLESSAALSGEGIKSVVLAGGGLATDTVEFTASPDKITVYSDAVIKAGKLLNVEVVDSVSLTIQSGSIEKMTVNKNAKDSVITLSSGVTVEDLTVNAAAAFMGKGTIQNARNGVSGVTYATAPLKLNGTTTESGDDDDGDENTESTSFEPSSVSPAKNATGVAVTVNPTISFGKKLYDADGEAVTESYIEENVQLRRSSASGTQVAFEATLTSNSRFRLEPDYSFTGGTRYYVVIPAGVFTDADGNKNSRLSYYFTTEDDDDDSNTSATTGTVKFSPENGDTDIGIDDSIKITFSSAVRRQNGSEVSNSYLANTAIELREEKLTGERVGITATINSTKKIITIEPETPLKPGTRYYVIVTAGSLEYTSDSSNISRNYAYFTTSDEIGMSITPKNGATGVLANTDIVIEFNCEVFRPSGSNITTGYLEDDVIELRLSSANGTEQDFTAKLSSDKKTVTITPFDTLEAGKKYYVVIPAGVIINDNDTENKKLTSYFTVAATMAPSIIPLNKTEGVDPAENITISFSDALYDKSGNPVTEEYILENDVITLRKTSSSGTALDFDVELSSDLKTITVIPTKTFAANGTYYVAVTRSKLYNEDNKANTAANSTFYTSASSAPDFLPYDGETEVAADSNIEITFENLMYQIGGEALTKTYIENKVVELYKDSYDGEMVAFSASLSSDKQTITINPSKNLEGNTTYVVVIRAASMENANGKENLMYKSSFETAETVEAGYVFNPLNGSKNIPVNSSITLTFNSSVYRKNGGDASADYIASNAIKLEKSDGTEIKFTAAISSDKKVITITPKELLEENTRYKVTVVSGYLTYSDESTVKSSYAYFTTSDGTPTLNTFELVEAGVSSVKLAAETNVDGTLYVTAAAGDSVIEKTFELTANTKEEVTVSGLAASTSYKLTYYVEAENGKKSAEKNITAKTAGAVEIKISGITDNSANVTVSALSSGTLNLLYKVKNKEDVARVTGMSFEKDVERSFSIPDLESSTDYVVTAEFTDALGGVTKVTESFKTTEPKEELLEITEIRIKDSNGYDYNGEVSDNVCVISIEKATYVKISPVVTVENVDMTIEGAENGMVAVTPGETKEVKVTVSLKDSEKKVECTVKISVGA